MRYAAVLLQHVEQLVSKPKGLHVGESAVASENRLQVLEGVALELHLATRRVVGGPDLLVQRLGGRGGGGTGVFEFDLEFRCTR